MTEKGFRTLDNFINEFGSEQIEAVITCQDESVKNDFYHEIILLCKSNNIKVYNRNEKYILKSDYSIAISWRWVIKNINKPKLIIIHDSLLPKYRGFNPLVSYLLNKENYIGATMLYASHRVDYGDIIYQIKMKIRYPLKIQEAILIVSELYYKLVRKFYLATKSAARIVAYKQDGKKATYSMWRDDKDYKIDWNKDSKYLKRFIDSVGYPYKGAYTFLNNRKIIINDAKEKEDRIIENRVPGKVFSLVNGNPLVVCGKGLLELTDLRSINGHIIKISKIKTRFD